MMKNLINKKLLLITLLLCFGLIIGCQPKETHFSSSDDAGAGNTPAQPPPSMSAYVADAWTAYNSANLSEVETLLSDMRYYHYPDYQDYPPYWNVAGWLETANHNLDNAADNFTEAVTLDTTYTDAYVGLAAVELSDGLYAECITNAATAISLDPDYSPGHDSLSIDHVRLLLAQAYVYNNELANAYAQVQILDPAYTLDLNEPDADVSLLDKIYSIYYSL